MLQAYVDEAGIHGGAKVCCVGGYFGGINQWKKFDRQWRKILDREGIQEFHSKKFWARDKDGNRVGVYKNWNKQRAKQFQDDLVAVIQNNRIFPFSAAVVLDDWNSLREDERRWLTGAFLSDGQFTTSGAPNRPYYLALGFCIQKVAQYCKQGLRVDYSFDLNHSYRGYSMDFYALMKRWNMRRDRMGEIAFPTSEEAPPLQAADLLVFHGCRYSVKALAIGVNPVQEDSVLARLVQNMKDKHNDAKIYDMRGLRFVLESYVPPNEETDEKNAKSKAEG